MNIEETYNMEIEAFHPGSFLKEEMKARKVSHYELAEELYISQLDLYAIVREASPITAEIAVKLEKLWDISAEYWFSMQNAFDLQQAKKAINEPQSVIHYDHDLVCNARPSTPIGGTGCSCVARRLHESRNELDDK